MDPDKVRFLFRDWPDGADPDDSDDRIAVLSEEVGQGSHGLLVDRMHASTRELLCKQIAADDPPEVWATAQRLLRTGMERSDVLSNLLLALLPHVTRGQSPRLRDRSSFVQSLARLPLPTDEQVRSALRSRARTMTGIDADELVAQTAAGFGFAIGDEFLDESLDENLQDLIEDGALTYLPADVVIDPGFVAEHVVLTTRVNDALRHTGRLSLQIDLALFSCIQGELTTSDGRTIEVSCDGPFDEHAVWQLDPASFADMAVGDLVAVSVRDGGVDVRAVQGAREPGPDVVSLLVDAFERQVEGPGLPETAADIQLMMAVTDGEMMASVQAPFGECAEAARLEVRGVLLADDAQLWARQTEIRRLAQVMSHLGPGNHVDTIMEAITTLATEPEELDLKAAAGALTTLYDPALLNAAVDAFLDDDDPQSAWKLRGVAERCLHSGHRSRPNAVAHWLAAVASERLGDPLGARDHLRAALHEDAQWAPGIERLGWYASDAGEAAEAVRLWRRLDPEQRPHDDLATVERFVVADRAGSEPGRNEPCWCGSGRKFKVCHLGKPLVWPLEDRIQWVVRKLVGYLERRGGSTRHEALELARAQAEARGGDVGPDDIWDLAETSLNVDVMLTEGGWSRRFLEERKLLLPADEASMVEDWCASRRSLYEVTEVQPGASIQLLDLRSAELVEVKEATFSRETSVGDVVCARVVPVSRHFELHGAIFRVGAGREADLLDILDRGDPHELMSYVGSLERKPSMANREGEPLVDGTAILDVGPEAASVLSQHFERGEGESTWREMYDLDPSQRILRATLTLDGERLTVAANSDARLDRVVARVRALIPATEIVMITRTPLAEALRARRSSSDDQDASMPQLPPDVVAQLQEQMEDGWCDEEVPALGGVTPRQAAHDPSRREALLRLLAEFDAHDGDLTPESGFFAMRPWRLRSILGLPDPGQG